MEKEPIKKLMGIVKESSDEDRQGSDSGVQWDGGAARASVVVTSPSDPICFSADEEAG